MITKEPQGNLNESVTPCDSFIFFYNAHTEGLFLILADEARPPLSRLLAELLYIFAA